MFFRCPPPSDPPLSGCIVTSGTMLAQNQDGQADCEPGLASLLFTSVFADVLLPHLDGGAKRTLRLTCKFLRESVDDSTTRIVVKALKSPRRCRPTEAPDVSRWAENLSHVHMEFQEPAWLSFLNADTKLPKLTCLYLIQQVSACFLRIVHGIMGVCVAPGKKGMGPSLSCQLALFSSFSCLLQFTPGCS